MDVALLSAVPVGVVSWHSPEPSLTVVVKATFSLATAGEAALASVQEPLGLDARHPDGEPDELEHASDFAPLKARADILLVGCAYAAQPSTALPAALRVDQLEVRFVATAERPMVSLPLVSRHLRSPSPDQGRLRLGPRPARQAGWTGQADRSGFDFGCFNVAPESQQVELLRAGSKVRLDGLLPDAPRRDVQLPGLRPRVFYVPDRAARSLVAADVALRCDTLWIDSKRALATLTWRGVVVLDAAHGSASYLAVALQPRGMNHCWDTVATQLEAARWVRAVEPGDAVLPADWVRPAPAAAKLPRAAVLPGAGISEAAFGDADTQALPGGTTAVIDQGSLVGAPLPFVDGQIPSAPAPDRAALAPREADPERVQAAAAPAPARAAGAETAVLSQAAVLPGDPLPFATANADDASPTGPDRPPPPPIPGELGSDPEVSLEEYVALRAAIDEAEDASAVLELKGIGIAQWDRMRQGWHRRSLADPELARALRQGLLAARRALGGGEG